GLALTFAPGIPQVTLAPELVFFGFLPPLLFAGGYFTSLREFKANLRPIVLLAVGLVLFTATLVALVAHALVPGLGWAGPVALAGGVFVGMAIGWLIDKVAENVADVAIFTAIGLVAPYAAYLPAESIGVSGVLATVVAGVWSRHAMRHASSDARVVGAGVWQIWLFLLNGIVFALLGLQLPEVVRNVHLGGDTITATVAIVAAVVFGRFVWVFPFTYG